MRILLTISLRMKLVIFTRQKSVKRCTWNPKWILTIYSNISFKIKSFSGIFEINTTNQIQSDFDWLNVFHFGLKHFRIFYNYLESLKFFSILSFLWILDFGFIQEFWEFFFLLIPYGLERYSLRLIMFKEKNFSLCSI